MDTLLDELLVFPAIPEDVPHHRGVRTAKIKFYDVCNFEQLFAGPLSIVKKLQRAKTTRRTAKRPHSAGKYERIAQGKNGGDGREHSLGDVDGYHHAPHYRSYSCGRWWRLVRPGTLVLTCGMQDVPVRIFIRYARAVRHLVPGIMNVRQGPVQLCDSNNSSFGTAPDSPICESGY
jgi:hypothetical protein